MPGDSLDWVMLPATCLVDDPSISTQWDAVNAEGADLPFLAASSISAALRAFGGGREQLLIGRHEERPLCLAVVVPIGRGRWQTFQPSQLPLGAWVATLGQCPRRLALEMLQGPLRLKAVLMALTQVDPLFFPRPPDHPLATSVSYVDTGWIKVEGDFETYWAHRSKNLRANLRKQRKHLRESGITTEIVWHRSTASMPSALHRFGELESTGWKGREGTAVEAGNAQGHYYLEMLNALAEAGEAAICEYLFDGKVVASNLCVERGHVFIVLKTAFDETVDKRYSPAFLLREEQLLQLFGQGRIQRFEYYGRFREWQKQWTSEQRPLYHLNGYRWRWLKILHNRQRDPVHGDEGD